MQKIQIPGVTWALIYTLASGLLVANFGNEVWVYAVLGAVAAVLKAYDIFVDVPEQPQAQKRGTVTEQPQRSKLARWLVG